jgi:signal transduction histidine kinase
VRRRLFLQIYLGFLAVAAIYSVAVGAFHWFDLNRHGLPLALTASARRFAADLPGPESSHAELSARLGALADEYGVDVTVWNADGEPVGHGGVLLTGRKWHLDDGEEFRVRRGTISMALPDGRRLGIQPDFRGGNSARPLMGLATLGAVIAVVAWPVSRRIARRLENLRSAVEDLGRGDFGARVPEEGRDEIADLARSFNDAAGRIESLVAAQRRVLASASHELRSPLTRLRMAIELVANEGNADVLAGAERDIGELDELIEDVLTTARLEAGRGPCGGQPVELLELLSDAAPDEVDVRGEPLTVNGDTRLLRRMLRNLMDNALRHGGGPIDVELAPFPGGGARISVADRGRGIAGGDRKRIFEPFYRPPGHAEGRDGGVGLGLALVLEIARLHGGDARCRPREGGGTVFEVEIRGLPAAR